MIRAVEVIAVLSDTPGPALALIPPIDINFAARARLLGFTPFLHQLRRLRTLLGLTPCAGSTHLRTHFAAVEHLDVS
jgi:hypothetical protein